MAKLKAELELEDTAEANKISPLNFMTVSVDGSFKEWSLTFSRCIY